MRPNFITDKIEHDRFVSRVCSLVDTSSCLPNNVFKKSFYGYYFISFDWLLDEDFLMLLKELSANFNDTTFDLWAPCKEDNFQHNYNYYPAISFDMRSVARNEYTKAIVYDPDPSGMSIRFRSKVLVLSGGSLEWAIWGDREFELGVIAVSREVPAFSTGKFDYIQFVDIEGALNLTSARFSRGGLPEEVAMRFINNYSSKSILRKSE